MRIIGSDSETATVELTGDEVRMVRQALNEVCNGPDAVEDWEFPTRMGVERSEAKRLLADLRVLRH